MCGRDVRAVCNSTLPNIVLSFLSGGAVCTVFTFVRHFRRVCALVSTKLAGDGCRVATQVAQVRLVFLVKLVMSVEGGFGWEVPDTAFPRTEKPPVSVVCF